MSKLKYLLVVFSLGSCQPKNDYKTNGERLHGLWAATYSNNDMYQEIFFTDSLILLLNDDYEVRFRSIDFGNNDSIKLYHGREMYLEGKIRHLDKNKVEITFNGFKSELNRIDRLLLDDKTMSEIIEGTERNEEKERLWIERFFARMDERKETEHLD